VSIVALEPFVYERLTRHMGHRSCCGIRPALAMICSLYIVATQHLHMLLCSIKSEIQAVLLKRDRTVLDSTVPEIRAWWIKC
jgi:hypothetical protein